MRVGIPLVALVLLLLALPATTFAHANLERAEPAPGSQLDQSPSQLRLSFSEAVDGSFSRVQLLNAQGDAVDRGGSRVAADDPRSLVVALPDGLSNGVYTVAWRTLSAVDGHTVNGGFPLIVGPMPAEGVPVATAATSSEARFSSGTAVARWWFSLAASAVFGTLLAWTIVYVPVCRRTGQAGLLGARSRTRRVVLVSGIVLLVGTLYGALAQAANAADVPLWAALGRPLIDLLAHGRFAALWWSRLALVVLGLGVVSALGLTTLASRVTLVLAALALLTSSLNSHEAALVSGAYLAVAADWLHFLAVGAWIGGLISLVLVLPSVLSASQDRAAAVRAQVVARFSSLALVSVVVIAVTGSFQAWLQVGSWDGLIQTAYGLSIVAKIGLMLLMLVLAAFNLLIVKPGLARGLASSGVARIGTLAQRFHVAVRGELLLGLIVLAVAAVLTGLSPARDEIAQRSGNQVISGPVDRTVDATGLRSRIVITPNLLGINRLAVQLPGTDPGQVERVQLTLTYLDSELGSQPVVLPHSSSASDTWETTTALLSQAGTWQAEMLVRRTGQDDARTALRFIVATPGGTSQTRGVAASTYPLLPSPLVSLAYLLIATGIIVAAIAAARAAREPGRRRRMQRQLVLGVAGVVLLGCGGYVYAAEQRNGVPLDVANIRNPIPPDERSLTIGHDIYTSKCEVCHGETGRGDGPAGLRLVPRPADLRVHTAPGVHTDGELFYWVSYGFAGTAMPAWKDTLSQDEIWSVLNYARATFGNSGT